MASGSALFKRNGGSLVGVIRCCAFSFVFYLAIFFILRL